MRVLVADAGADREDPGPDAEGAVRGTADGAGVAPVHRPVHLHCAGRRG